MKRIGPTYRAPRKEKPVLCPCKWDVADPVDGRCEKCCTRAGKERRRAIKWREDLIRRQYELWGRRP